MKTIRISRYNMAFWFGICDLSETAVKYPSKDAGQRIRETLRDMAKCQRKWLAGIFRERIVELKKQKVEGRL
ncbi:MAG: hypothetical protein KGL39_27095 [Patescibacteria group bacterium]|nr:hypothetical protein [Patescibacteria group bacterium]